MKLCDFVTGTYIPTYLPLLSSSTQNCYKGVISKYLKPTSGNMCLRNLTRQTLQQYFSGMVRQVSYPTISKIRDALPSILSSAVDAGYLNKSGMDGVRLPLDKRPRRPKPTITPQRFHNLMQLISEPYATMIYVAAWTGLRISELVGLKWRCIHEDSITIEQRSPRRHPISGASIGRRHRRRAKRPTSAVLT
jgi:integrase